MSTLGTYSFLPWLREGMANQIESADLDPSVLLRAEISVQLELEGDNVESGSTTLPVERTVGLYGPGDIVGIENDMIVRVEPRHWITNFEPNYVPHIEFYDEDFPWRYTPAAPASGRLRPWITLIVLKEDEFQDGVNVQNRPLPFIDIADLGALPRADELWAWAHVHVNASLSATDDEHVSTDMDQVMPKLKAVLQDPDRAYSRLVCARKLSPSTGYHAFLIPTFEVGRRAGLGLDSSGVMATLSAWDASSRPQGSLFPYYHRWYFRTGTSGDFETLVRLLKPAVVNPKVGRRDMDVQDPGPGVRPVENEDLGGILKLGGALKPPLLPEDLYDQWDQPFPRPIQEDLASLANLPDDYRRDGDPDPVVAPPIYGQWHALRHRLLLDENGDPMANDQNWLHRLNLDPRYRVAAGFGTRVIQDQQEALMDAAWEQVGEILAAQRRYRLGQLAVATSEVWFGKHLQSAAEQDAGQALLLLGPLQKRILIGGSTIHHQLRQSTLQPAFGSIAMRRVLNPRGRTMKRLGLAPAGVRGLVERAARGDVRAAPLLPPPEISTLEIVSEAARPAGVPPWITDLLEREPRLPTFVGLGLAGLGLVASVIPFIGPLILVASLLAGAFAFGRLRRIAGQLGASRALREDAMTPEAVDAYPPAPDFSLRSGPSPSTPGRRSTAAGETRDAARNAGPDRSTDAGPSRSRLRDSPEATLFKRALKEQFDLVASGRQVAVDPVRAPIPDAQLARDAIDSLHPRITIPKRVSTQVKLSPNVLAQLATGIFIEPMAYPVIDLPMYEPLVGLGEELFLPNINLIEQNTITLLESNQEFIESYMVGLNHEFARELLWREYPTDSRGSTFRQFWDVRSVLNREQASDEEFRESLRDIPPLHEWPMGSALGEHDHREQPGDSEDELVLVIRGELLKRYPNAVIYAHRACWQRKPANEAEEELDPCQRTGPIDAKQERRLVALSPAEEDSLPAEKIRTPLYEAKVKPDIYFIGFDLTAEDAVGETGANQDDDPGWFFVIRERPGEPRFGLDTDSQPAIHVFNDLAWQDMQPGPEGSYLEIDQTPASIELQTPGVLDQEKAVQHGEDAKVEWSHAATSAHVAYVLFQAPVLVGVHASEMLPRNGHD